MALCDIESQLLALDPEEKIEAVRALSRSLGVPLPEVEAAPGTCGGDARLAGTRVPVWVLAQARQLGSSDIEILRKYPIAATDLFTAWLYAEAYSSKIRVAILENQLA